jgi:predicted Zn-dependent peptidase
MHTTYTLSNGVRVVFIPLKDTHTVTAIALFGVGSRYETKELNGSSHFIEHLMFKGTEKRPNSLAISKELDGVGAEYNAYTGKDHTGYYVKVNYEQLSLALDVVSDMLFHSKFDPEEMEREKKVIAEEIRMYRDNPMMYVDNLLEQVMFLPSSLGWDIAGDVETVHAFHRDSVMSYMHAHYRPENTVIGVAGNFDIKKAREDVQKLFSQFPPAPTGSLIPSYTTFDVSTVASGPCVLTHFKETEQVQLALGWYGRKYLHPDSYTLSVLANILGGTMSSRLFISVRERLGLCYYIRATHQPYQDTGNFYIQAGLDKSRIQEAIPVVLKEIEKIKREGITDSELKRAQDNIKGRMAIQLEDSEHVVSWYSTQEILTKTMLTPQEKLDKIYAVMADDVKRVANDLFGQNALHLAVIGPYHDSKEFDSLVAMT